MQDCELWFNNRPQGKWKHGFVTPGAAWDVEAGCRREQAALGHMPSLGSLGGVLSGSWPKARLVNSNPKEQGSDKLHRGLI